jgi:hydroxylamine reductase
MNHILDIHRDCCRPVYSNSFSLCTPFATMFLTRAVIRPVSRFTRRSAVMSYKPTLLGFVARSLIASHSHATFSTKTAVDPVTAHPTPMMPDMFCRQCEQTADHFACTTVGICGKTSETAACQDTLIHMIKSVSTWADQARISGVTDLNEANVWTLSATFSTLTNVNFSDERIAEYITQGQVIQKDLVKKLAAAGGTPPSEDIASLDLTGMSVAQLEDFGHTVSIPVRQTAMDHVDAFSLNEMATYGLKGACAYAMHCHQLGVMDQAVMKNVHSIFRKLASSEPDMDGLLKTVLLVGETSGQVLKNLDEAHCSNLGAPEPSQVRMTVMAGKCILVSGHDMMDLYELLKQTQGKGINVYTHGEMQPAHAYPKLKEFDHLVGNYGTA